MNILDIMAKNARIIDEQGELLHGILTELDTKIALLECRVEKLERPGVSP